MDGIKLWDVLGEVVSNKCLYKKTNSLLKKSPILGLYTIYNLFVCITEKTLSKYRFAAVKVCEHVIKFLWSYMYN